MQEIKQKIKWFATLIRDVLSIPLLLIVPRRRNKIIFGAWKGEQYGCNPKYLFEYVVGRGGFEAYWIGRASLKEKVEVVPGAKFVEKGSLAAFYHCLTARFYVYNISWRLDILDFPTIGRVKKIYTTHGYPDKKVLDGLDGHGNLAKKSRSRTGVRAIVQFLLVCLYKWLYDEKSWFSASSRQGDALRIKGEPDRLSQERALHAGLPRGDFAVNNASNVAFRKQLREKYSRLLGIAQDKRWFLFVPTWRHEEQYLFSFTTSIRKADYERLLSAQGAIIIEKQHPHTLMSGKVKPCCDEHFFVVDKQTSQAIDTQELQLASDCLITDYSSVYYDSVLMGRPVIHFIYDYDHFMNVDMGFAFDIKDYGGGPFAETEDELLDLLAKPEAELLARRNPRTVSEQLEFEKGHSCETYYALLKKLAEL